MAEVTVSLRRRKHTFDNPEGVTYVPPLPEPQKPRQRLDFGESISERWIADGHGFVGEGRTIKEAQRARDKAESNHRNRGAA